MDSAAITVDRRASLGVTTYEQSVGMRRVEVITAIEPGSSAERAGLRVLDRISWIGGADIAASWSVSDAVQQSMVGASLEVRIHRDGKEATIPVELSAAPSKTRVPALRSDPLAILSLPSPDASGFFFDSPKIRLAWEKKGNSDPIIYIERRGAFRDTRSGTFPLTNKGWSEALRQLRSDDPVTFDDLQRRFEQAEKLRLRGELRRRGLMILASATLLGGYGYRAMSPGQAYDLAWLQETLVVTVVGDGRALFTADYEELVTVDIGGPGLVQKGGGFIGGGFGVEGIAEGMLLASVLNALTTKREIQTLIQINGDDLELFFLYSGAPPDLLRIAMSPVLGALSRARRQVRALPSPTAVQADVASQLERLVALRATGTLTDEEFSAAKAVVVRQ